MHGVTKNMLHQQKNAAMAFCNIGKINFGQICIAKIQQIRL